MISWGWVQVKDQKKKHLEMEMPRFGLWVFRVDKKKPPAQRAAGGLAYVVKEFGLTPLPPCLNNSRELFGENLDL